MKAYKDALEYLYGLEKFGTVFGLDNITWILGLLGDPHRSLKAVHVAGTNGKGSVATILASILQAQGYKVGKYTSPHLLSFTERITVNGEEIEEREVAAIAAEMREKVMKADSGKFFTFFDFTTALAFDFFLGKGVDISIIETGLGGRLDSTNVLEPMVSVVTNVELDHSDYLGHEIPEIAREKAGIIKRGVPVVTGAYGAAFDVISQVARDKGSRLYLMGRDFSYEKTGDRHMTYTGLEMGLKNLFVNLRGDHQLGNGALALCAAECLGTMGFPADESSIREGLSGVVWPGRLELVHESPSILLDGAHNPHGARALRGYLEDHYREGKKILVFGVMKDKEYGTMVQELLPLFDEVIFTKPAGERALSPYDLGGYAPGAVMTANVRDALEEARRIARNEDLIVVTGSLYTVGEARSIIDEIF